MNSPESLAEVPVRRAVKPAPPVQAICGNCEAPLADDAVYCHSCGASLLVEEEKPSKVQETMARVRESFAKGWNLDVLRQRTGLNPAAMVAFALGALCLFGAILVGLLYTPQTVVDWQAIQSWREQWLLAAIAFFVGGVLVKRPQQ